MPGRYATEGVVYDSRLPQIHCLTVGAAVNFKRAGVAGECGIGSDGDADQDK